MNMYILIGIRKRGTYPVTIRSSTTKEGLICPVLIEDYEEYKFLGVIHLSNGKASNVEEVLYAPPSSNGNLKFTGRYTP